MSNYLKTLDILKELKLKHPSYNLGRHIATALSDYGDIWGLTDKEVLFAFQKYSSELDLDILDMDEEYVNKVIEDAKDLNYILDDEE